jgi:hypothetical protein
MNGIKQRMKILIQLRIFAKRLGMSRKITRQVRKAYWNLVRRPDISGVQNQTVQFVKSEHPVLTG